MSGSSAKGALLTTCCWHSQCAGFLLALPLWMKSDCQVPGMSPRNGSIQRKRETPRMFLLEARLSLLESSPTPGDLPLLLLTGVGHVAFLTQYLANQRGLPWLAKPGRDPFLTVFRIPSWIMWECGPWHERMASLLAEFPLDTSSHSGPRAALFTGVVLFCHIWFSVDTLLNCLVSVDIHTISRYRINYLGSHSSASVSLLPALLNLVHWP